MKKRHVNIPIFIPHLGCPNNCVFCNQRTISGHGDFKIDDVKSEIDEALSTLDENTEREIAFFGGSFTGIDRALMIELLDLAESYVNRGLVSEIRLSTRPDYINDEILDILLIILFSVSEFNSLSIVLRQLSSNSFSSSVKNAEEILNVSEIVYPPFLPRIL